jgi:hypothetical protein
MNGGLGKTVKPIMESMDSDRQMGRNIIPSFDLTELKPL